MSEENIVGPNDTAVVFKSNEEIQFYIPNFNEDDDIELAGKHKNVLMVMAMSRILNMPEFHQLISGVMQQILKEAELLSDVEDKDDGDV